MRNGISPEISPVSENGSTSSENLEKRSRHEENSNANLSNFVSEVELLLVMNFLGIAGNMGRSGLIQLLGFENLGSVWPNFTGCFIIAFAPVIFGPVMSVAVSTGFCGAMTSFSETITDIFSESTTPLPNWPDDGYGVPLFMARLLLETSCCFAAYLVGTHLSRFWTSSRLPVLRKDVERILMVLLEVLGVAAWVVCLVTAITSPNHSRWWPLSGIFAPFGVWARYYLSKFNRSNVWFKWGTFSANMFSTAVSCVLGLCLMLPHRAPAQIQVMLALQRGFCGCLSTFSTFTKEMNTMKTHHGYLYGFISLFCGYSLAFIIMGSYKWTH
nr:Fex1 [Starmerella bombicola]